MLRGLVDTPERRVLFAAGTLLFLAIGAMQAMYGPAFPAFLARYHVGVGQVGAVVSAHFLGSFVTIAASGVLLVRFGYRRLLLAGTAGLTLGAAGVALSPSWGLTLAAALLGGLGFGLVDVATNLLFARWYGARATGALNLLNAAFGLGAVLGPVAVGLLAPRVAPAFLLVAFLTVIAAAFCARAPMPEPLAVPAGALRAARAPLLGFMVLYFLYVSSEVGVASWEPTYLAPLLGQAHAAFFTGLYWGSLTFGRFVAALLGERFRPADMVLGASLLALGAAWLANATQVAPLAYALVGFAFAPIFPTALAWLQQVFPQRSEQITPVVIAVASLGPVLTAPAIGWAVAWSGTARIPMVLGSLVLALCLVIAMMWRAMRGGAGDGGSARPSRSGGEGAR
ncbi:MAG: MFS transporter [Deinococcales bacterium]